MKNQNIEVYDIECTKNLFMYCGIDIKTQERQMFIIHESRNHLVENFPWSMCEYWKTLYGQIGFNNLDYDSQIIQFIINNEQKLNKLSAKDCTAQIYKFSQKVISKSEFAFNEYPEWGLSIQQMDLYKIWHFNNAAKSTSLKWIEFMLNWDNIQELPFKHDQDVNAEQVKLIEEYCWNDVLVTYELYKITKGDTNLSLYKGIDKIQLRKDIQQEFGIKCINYNDVKIGDELNKYNYCLITGIDKKELPKPDRVLPSLKYKDCFPEYIKFETPEFNKFIDSIKEVDLDFKKKQEFKFKYNGTEYTVAKGGLHSNDKPRKIVPDKNEILIDSDVGSMYPHCISKRGLYPKHLGDQWLVGYKDIIQKRLKAKKEGKKSVNEALKLALNGGSFGKTNQENSWQYDPEVTYKTTIGSQIDLLMLIEKLEINDIHCISANTDGIICLFPSLLLDKYYKVCREWETEVGNSTSGNLEYLQYSSYYQLSVNDYIAVDIKGKIKKKGDFCTEFELHKNSSKRVIPLALEAYFLKGVQPEEFIKNHTNIYDFCIGNKSKGKNRVVSYDSKSGEEFDLQKVNRYYVSTQGVNLLKKMPALPYNRVTKQYYLWEECNSGVREAELEASWLSTVFNTYQKKEDYGINFEYYILQVKNIIKEIEK